MLTCNIILETKWITWYLNGYTWCIQERKWITWYTKYIHLVYPGSKQTVWAKDEIMSSAPERWQVRQAGGQAGKEEVEVDTWANLYSFVYQPLTVELLYR